MMGLRIPKAHKAISEARVREHPSDVDLRYTVIGLAVLGFFVVAVVSAVMPEYDSGKNGKIFGIAISASFPLMLILYIAAKTCRAFPRGARWTIFYLSLTASLIYLVLALFVDRAVSPIAGYMWFSFAVISWVSVRQIYKYHRNKEL